MVEDPYDPDAPRASYPPFGGEEGEPVDPRRRMERLVRETVRRAVERGVEAGLGTISRSQEAIRGVIGSEVPREVVHYIFGQIDETKNALVRGVAREVRDFLEATDMASELERALTRLSFEIKTEIRFIPNEAGGVRPSVKASAMPRRSRDGHEGHEGQERKSTPPRRSREGRERKSTPPPPGDENE
ncbi:MAG: hypothetical protein ACODAU_05075 [Myxococcota bacterium]